MSQQFRRLSNVGVLQNAVFTALLSVESNDLVTGARVDITVFQPWFMNFEWMYMVAYLYEQRKDQVAVEKDYRLQ